MLNNKKIGFNFKILIFIIIILNISIIYFFSFNRLYLNLGQNLEIFLNEPIFIDQKDNKKKIIKNLLESSINKITHKNDFETLSIDVSFNNFQKIKENRLESLKEQFLVRQDFIRAKVNFQKKTYDAEIRLKGDTKQHWYLPKQWSLKIKILNGQSILGMKSFAITRHSARSYPLNITVSKILSNMEMLTPEYGNVNIEINGQDWGLMHYEEMPSNAYIERKSKTYSNFFKIGSENYWKNLTYLNEITYQNDSINLDMLYHWQDRLDINFYNEKYFKNEIGIKKTNYIIGIYEDILLDKINKNNLSKYFDFDSFSIALINSFILGEIHSLDLPNSKYYLNPYNLKIEIIPNDFGEIKKLKYNDSLPANLNSKTIRLPFFEKIIFTEEFTTIYLKNLELFYNFPNEFKKYITIYCKKFNSSCMKNYNHEIVNENTKIILKKGKIQLLEFQKFIKEKKENLNKLSFDHSIFKNVNVEDFISSHIYSNIYKNGDINIYNTTPYQLNLSKIIFYKKDCLNSCVYEKYFDNILIQPSNFKNISFIKQKFNVNLDEYDYYEIITILNDNPRLLKGKIIDREINNNFYNENYIFDNPDIFKVTDESIEIKKGNWIITEPIIIFNKNLIINNDVQIKFNTNTFIHIKNGSLLINHKSENLNNSENAHKVNLKANDTYWKGIYVENDSIKNKSILKNVSIQDTKNFSYGIYNLMGGVNFYRSIIEINNLIFDNSFSEDQINFIDSNFKINNSFFSNSYSDSIDSDFSEGEIRNTIMNDINGDAIDTSSSQVNLYNIKIENVYDKGLSIGEESHVNAENINIRNSGVGIAIKDSSYLNLKGLKNSNSFIADILSINKKNYFSYSKAFIYSDLEINENNLMIENGNLIYVNDKLIPTKNINVKQLYQLERMKKNAI